jgi:hypothetical protein
VKIPSKIYVNIYQPFAGQIGTAYATRELADQMAARGRLACVEIDNLRGTARFVGAELGQAIEVTPR